MKSKDEEYIKEQKGIRKQILLLVPRICVVKNNSLICTGTCGLILKELIKQIEALSIVAKNFVCCVIKFYSRTPRHGTMSV
jgi:arginine exporter protein ArgO